jgi:hypothetical protein
MLDYHVVGRVTENPGKQPEYAKFLHSQGQLTKKAKKTALT